MNLQDFAMPQKAREQSCLVHTLDLTAAEGYLLDLDMT